jgi:DNA-binding transcriptional LysR family regulator
MSKIDLRHVDLNLLVVLEVLLEERSVSRAAARLGRTQSAVSHSLRRLREQLGDLLLVRVGAEMRPSPYAETLAIEVARILRAVERVLSTTRPFDPATSDRVFAIAAPDFALTLLSRLVGQILTTVPNSAVEWYPPAPNLLRDVVDGRYDVSVAPMLNDNLPEGLAHDDLGLLKWVVFARRGHPAIANWGVKAWRAYPHVVVRVGGDTESTVSQRVRQDALTRRIGIYAPNFSVVAPMLAHTDMLATLPGAVLAEHMDTFGLVALEVPVPIPPIVHCLYWSARLSNDPAVVWLRGVVADAFRKLLEDAEKIELIPVRG